jgi:hypothetical protein
MCPMGLKMHADDPTVAADARRRAWKGAADAGLCMPGGGARMLSPEVLQQFERYLAQHPGGGDQASYLRFCRAGASDAAPSPRPAPRPTRTRPAPLSARAAPARAPPRSVRKKGNLAMDSTSTASFLRRYPMAERLLRGPGPRPAALAYDQQGHPGYSPPGPYDRYQPDLDPESQPKEGDTLPDGIEHAQQGETNPRGAWEGTRGRDEHESWRRRAADLMRRRGMGADDIDRVLERMVAGDWGGDEPVPPRGAMDRHSRLAADWSPRALSDFANRFPDAMRIKPLGPTGTRVFIR